MARVRRSIFPIAWIAVLLIVVYAGCSSNDKGGTNPPGPKTGTLNISSTPSGASITLDATAETDTTPATFADVDSGSHTITLSKDGYDDWDSTVYVPAGGEATASATLQLTMYTLNLFAVGSGQVHKDPDASSYLPGTEVEISAVPDAGWSFTGWTGQYASTKNPDTVTMTQDWTTTANFEQLRLVSPVAFLDTSHTNQIVIYRQSGWLGDPATGDFAIQFDPAELDSFSGIVTAWDDLDQDYSLEDGEPIGWWDANGDGNWDNLDHVMFHRGDTIQNVVITMAGPSASPSRIAPTEQVDVWHPASLTTAVPVWDSILIIGNAWNLATPASK